MTDDVDTRLRQAGASLRQASRGLDPTSPPRGRGGLTLLAAALVLAVLGAAAAMLLRDDDHRQPDVSTDVGSVPRLVPGTVPRELPPAGATDLPPPDQGEAGRVAVSVYGDPAADDPFADADLALFAHRRGDFMPDTPAVIVRGRAATVETSPPHGTFVTWEEEAGLVVMAGSHSLRRDQLLAVVEGLTVEHGAPSPGTVPPGLPGPLELVAATEMSPALSPPVPASATGHLVGYQHPEDGRGALVAAFAGDGADVAVVRWIAGATTATDVRGHRAWAGSHRIEDASAGAGSDGGEDPVSGTSGTAGTAGTAGSGPSMHTLVWEEAPGVVVVVQGYGLDAGDVRTVAESLRPAGDAEWEELLALTDGDGDSGRATASEDGASSSATVTLPETGGRPGITVPGDPEAVLQGGYARGTWAVYLDADGSLCGVTETDEGGAETCSSTPERAVVLNHAGDPAEPVLVYGIQPEGTRGRTFPGTAITGSSQSTETPDGRILYAAVVHGGPLPSEVGFIGEDGRVVETVPITPR